MAVSQEYADFIKERLEIAGDVFMRRMFGGVGIYCDQVFFALIADNVLYFKVDEINLPDFEKAGMEPFRPYGNDGGAMSYYEVPGDVIEDNQLLLKWINKALDVARRAPKSKKKSKSKK